MCGKDYSVNGECINCNECCSVNLPLTRKEYKFFKKVIAVNIKAIRNNYEIFMKKGLYYLRCPFSDLESKQCQIYKDRPTICRIYHCHKELRYDEETIKLAKANTSHNLIDCLPKDIQRNIREGFKKLKEFENE